MSRLPLTWSRARRRSIARPRRPPEHRPSRQRRPKPSTSTRATLSRSPRRRWDSVCSVALCSVTAISTRLPSSPFQMNRTLSNPIRRNHTSCATFGAIPTSANAPLRSVCVDLLDNGMLTSASFTGLPSESRTTPASSAGTASMVRGATLSHAPSRVRRRRTTGPPARDPSHHDERSAFRGSIWLARAAGTQTAINAITAISTGTPTNTSGSRAATPNNRVLM